MLRPACICEARAVGKAETLEDGQCQRHGLPIHSELSSIKQMCATCTLSLPLAGDQRPEIGSRHGCGLGVSLSGGKEQKSEKARGAPRVTHGVSLTHMLTLATRLGAATRWGEPLKEHGRAMP
jgi:hypothetical protein